MTELQELEHKSTSYIEYFRDHYPLYKKNEYKNLTGVSGIYMLFTEKRLVYIGTSSSIYNALHEIFNGSSKIRDLFLYDDITMYSYIKLAPYDRRISEDYKRSLLERFRPAGNYLLAEYKWVEQDMQDHIKKKLQPLEKIKNENAQLRKEKEVLQNKLDDLINMAIKIRNEK